MSLHQFQAVLAALIRCPAPDRDPAWRDQWLSRAQLPPEQLESLEALAAHDELNKYGREQRAQRWEHTANKISNLSLVFDDESLYGLWRDFFEPEHMQVPSDLASYNASYTVAFLDFLMQSPRARSRLQGEARPYIYDLIAFEKAQVQLEQVATKPYSQHIDSVLAHGYLRILAQNYDISGWLEILRHLPLSATQPNPDVKKMFLLLVRDGTANKPNVRMFEIDADVYQFVQGEICLGDRQALTSAVMDDLVAMGLVASERKIV